MSNAPAPASSSTTLYALGSNGAGQLGVGHQEDLSKPQQCKFTAYDPEAGSGDKLESSDRLVDDCVEKLVAGGNHTVILTKRGHVYAAGNNGDGRCGVAESLAQFTEFTFVRWAVARSITDVAATWEGTLFVEDARTVFVCGTGNKGELGLGQDVLQSGCPRKVFEVSEAGEGDVSITSISASMGHAVVLLSNGLVYGFGACRKGQLGDSFRSRKNIWEPHRIDVPFAVAHVTTGRDFTLFGGHNQEHTIVGDFNCTSGLKNLDANNEGCQLTAGWSTIYNLRQQSIQGYGPGRRGQLPPKGLPSIVTLAPGSEHCLAHAVGDNIIAWGWGEHGNCGLPVDERGCVAGRYNVITLPCEAGGIAGIGSGCATSFIWVTHQP